MKINWKQKLTSRKFWVALVGFVTLLLVTVGVDNLKVEQINGVIWSAGILIAYIIGEGMVDASRVSTQEQETNTNIEKKE